LSLCPEISTKNAVPEFHFWTSLKITLSQPLDRDEPNGRPQWRFTVFAQDEGGNGLVGYADVQVNLKDINDNAPLFPQGNDAFQSVSPIYVSVADPDPGSGAFLISGSGIRDGWKNPDHTFEILENNFWV
jgi:hypothetical protein